MLLFLVLTFVVLEMEFLGEPENLHFLQLPRGRWCCKFVGKGTSHLNSNQKSPQWSLVRLIMD